MPCLPAQAPSIIAAAHHTTSGLMNREAEVEFFREQWRALDSARARLDAARVVVAM